MAKLADMTIIEHPPKIRWQSPKRVLGRCIFDMLPTTGQMIDELVSKDVIENATGNYHLDVYDMCRNGAAYLGAHMANLIPETQIVEGTFMGTSHCWVVLEDYYFDMTIAQVDPSYPEFAVVKIKDARGYSEFARFDVFSWLKTQLKYG